MAQRRIKFAIALSILLLGPTSAHAFDFEAFDQQVATYEASQQSNPLSAAHNVTNEIVNSHFDGSFQSSLPKNISWTALTPTFTLDTAPLTIIPTPEPIVIAPVYITAPPSLPAFTFAQTAPQPQPQVNVNASPIIQVQPAQININITSPAAPPSLPFETMMPGLATFARYTAEPLRIYDFTGYEPPKENILVIKPAVVKTSTTKTYTTPSATKTTKTAETSTTPEKLESDKSCVECIKDLAETKKLVQEAKDSQEKADSTNFILLIVIGIISLFTFLRILFIKNN